MNTGDSRYPTSPYIVTPFADVQEGTREADFNVRHKHTRCLIERVFGELKGKWRCLKKERTMHYQPVVAANLFKCCVLLHSVLISQRYLYTHVLTFFLLYIEDYW